MGKPFPGRPSHEIRVLLARQTVAATYGHNVRADASGAGLDGLARKINRV